MPCIDGQETAGECKTTRLIAYRVAGMTETIGEPAEGKRNFERMRVKLSPDTSHGLVCSHVWQPSGGRELAYPQVPISQRPGKVRRC